MNLHADAARRLKVYKGLQARNRVVAVLRLGVPAMGAVALVLLVGQIYLSSLGSRFGVTFCQVAPLSRVMCTSPSSDPAQISPGSRREGASANTVA